MRYVYQQLQRRNLFLQWLTRNLVNKSLFVLTNSGSLIVDIRVKSFSVLSISSLASFIGVMRLLYHVGGAHNLTVFVYLLEDVNVGVVL